MEFPAYLSQIRHNKLIFSPQLSNENQLYYTEDKIDASLLFNYLVKNSHDRLRQILY